MSLLHQIEKQTHRTHRKANSENDSQIFRRWIAGIFRACIRHETASSTVHFEGIQTRRPLLRRQMNWRSAGLKVSRFHFGCNQV